MPFHQAGDLRYYAFDSLGGLEIEHAVFTRQGGASPAPWNSLNLGSTVGDALEHVVENRRRMFAAFGRPVESLYDVWLVHGNEVVCAAEPRPLDRPHLQADAILTDRPEVTLLMRFADCVPVLLYDPQRRVVGLAHAGWQGTVKQTAASAVQTMQTQYGCRPADIYAAIGPSIGPDHYQIGEDVAAQVRHVFGSQANALLPTQAGAVKLDLWQANRLVLERAGVQHIEVAGVCTACHLEDWYSHRAERGKTGRFAALIALKGA